MPLPNKHKCTGCSACVAICPLSAIKMSETAEGFDIPIVNQSICTNCGMCERVCPILQPIKIPGSPKESWAACSRDINIRLQSSSGGVFSEISRQILAEQGIVFAAGWDDKFTLKHQSANTFSELDVLRQSKYVQSSMGNIFCEVKQSLLSGRQALFVGTPCQIAGLKSFLHGIEKNLTSVDIACFGVPSPKVWKLYLKEELHDLKTEIENIANIYHRNKKNGWQKSQYVIEDKQGNTLLQQPLMQNPYILAFMRCLISRECCADCHFKQGRSGSDITIADFWGIEDFKVPMDLFAGVNLVIANTGKGQALINSLDLEKVTVEYHAAIKRNPAYYSSMQPHKKRSLFFQQLTSENVKIALFAHSQLSLIQKLMGKGRSLLRKLQRIVK